MGYASDHGIKALCFDIDGTFYPKNQMMIRLAVSSLAHLPFAIKYNSMRQRLRQETGFSEGSCADFAALREKESQMMYPGRDSSYFISKEEDVFRKPWEKLFQNIKPFDGVREALEEAKREGYIIAALSDFPLLSKLEALGIADLFDFKASAEDYGALKPSSRPFSQMLKALGVKADEALYTGDSRSKDIDGAKNIGMHTALISRSVKVYNKADVIFSSWEEFRKIVL
ncbi:MAG: HAD family hydrolase [Spirochaetes bacterium]|uniref:HAD family hydrolase n=1 Tax=Candidatus Ornithospirochaeta stercoripullorum TaxID=2840899 RepID=A0A9D9DYJ0_9SPIO|nr:HAD family hydrolase [Candidatus Ornithospirochaeta stercoripullorum]